VEFNIGDIHALEYDSASFDIVVAHTIMSHITDPQVAIKELARVTKPNGKVAIFDGDYASWTFAYPPDAGLAKDMEVALLKAVVNNPRVMRDMPVLLRNVGLRLENAMSYVLSEVGAGSFWASAFEAFAPVVVQTKLLPEDQVNLWLNWQRQAIADGVFFAASNYYTFIAMHPSEG
jgi:SAM-dependent methyltransferase